MRARPVRGRLRRPILASASARVMESGGLLLTGVLGGVAVAAVVLVLWILGRGRTTSESSRLTQTVSELAGRLDQMAADSAARQTAMSRAIEDRLDVVSKRLGQGLTESATRTAETLGDLKKHLNVIDTAQRSITEVSKELSGHVIGLQDILSNKQARGTFGEVQLSDLVQSVLPQAAYRLQVTLSNNKRVDCLIDLPNPPGPIANDAKFPLESYRAMCAAGDETARTVAGRGFRQDILKHVTDIADRYIIPGETADWALMFLPSEAIYAELHGKFSGVIEQTRRKRVAIVSPDTLWAMLTTVRAVLRDVQMHEQAGVIQKEVRAMLSDVERLDDRVGKLQRHFDQANDDMRQIRISTEKLTKRGENIERIELGEDAAAEELEPPLARLQAGDG